MLRPIWIMLLVLPLSARAEIAARDGWEVARTTKSFGALADATRNGIKAVGLITVTQAGPTRAAKARGIDIPGNLVIGAFNNDFAVRVLNLSTAAMIEAPIRFYVTENKDGTATLSYKRPSTVFAPYADEGGDALAGIAAELDMLFAKAAAQAVE